MFILVNHQLYWKSQNCFKFSIYGQTAISNFFFLKESWLCSVKLRAPSPSPESKFQAPHLPVAKAGYQSRRPGRSVRVLGRCPGGTAVTAPARTCAGGSPGEADWKAARASLRLRPPLSGVRLRLLSHCARASDIGLRLQKSE